MTQDYKNNPNIVLGDVDLLDDFTELVPLKEYDDLYAVAKQMAEALETANNLLNGEYEGPHEFIDEALAKFAEIE